MSSKPGFVRGFEKTANVVSTLGGAVAKGAKAAGKGVLALGGGALNTALTGLGAASDYGDISAKMRQAAQR